MTNSETKPIHELTIDELPYSTMVRQLAKAPTALFMERTPDKQELIGLANRLAATAERVLTSLDPVLQYHRLTGTLDSIRHGQWLHWEHMTFALAGEAAGELRDAVKKHVIYGKDLDVANIKEEAGDCTFYIEGARQFIEEPDYTYFWQGVTHGSHERSQASRLLEHAAETLDLLLAATIPDYSLEDAQRDNKIKLWEKRYKGGKYSDAAAIARADKAPT